MIFTKGQKPWNKKDLTGKKFGHWKVLHEGKTRVSSQGKKTSYWVCICDCDNPNTKEVACGSLVSGNSKSCGCDRRTRKPWNFKNLVGQRFGKLVAVSLSESSRYTSWSCLCDCKRKTIVRSTSLISGNTKSCGKCSRTGKNSPHWKNRIKTNCYECNKEIERLPRVMKINKKHFCDIRCRALWMSKLPPEKHCNWKGGRSHRTRTAKLYDSYIRSLFRAKGIKNEDITIEMIEEYRKHLLWLRNVTPSERIERRKIREKEYRKNNKKKIKDLWDSYHKKNKRALDMKRKAHRSKPEVQKKEKKYALKYRAENIDLIKKRLFDYRAALPDSYIKSLLKTATGIEYQQITPEMIKAKRQFVETIRLIKQRKKELKQCHN